MIAAASFLFVTEYEITIMKNKTINKHLVYLQKEKAVPPAHEQGLIKDHSGILLLMNKTILS